VTGDRKLIATQRQLVYERSGGQCERCGFALTPVWECHHRKLRSQGGDWSLANLLALHPSCHSGDATSIHGRPKAAYALGHLVRAGLDTSEMPVQLWGNRWVLLGPSGGYIWTEPP
jgi:hypothetical protein